MSSENSGYAEGSSRKVLLLIGRGVLAFHVMDALFENRKCSRLGCCFFCWRGDLEFRLIFQDNDGLRRETPQIR